MKTFKSFEIITSKSSYMVDGEPTAATAKKLAESTLEPGERIFAVIATDGGKSLILDEKGYLETCE